MSLKSDFFSKTILGKCRENGIIMEEIKKALQEIAKAVENNEAVTSIKVTITFKKQSTSKANPKEVK